MKTVETCLNTGEKTFHHTYCANKFERKLKRRFCSWTTINQTGLGHFSLRSKRFRLVLEPRNTEEGDFRYWPREKWNESQKVKEGEGEGKEGNFPSFLPHSLPALLLAPFSPRSLTLVPRSFLLNRTETLATQARDTWETTSFRWMAWRNTWMTKNC